MKLLRCLNKNASDYSLTIKERKGKTETLTSDQVRTKFEGADEIKQIKEDQDHLDGSKDYLVQNIMTM